MNLKSLIQNSIDLDNVGLAERDLVYGLLGSSGACLVRNVPLDDDNAALLQIASSLGPLVPSASAENQAFIGIVENRFVDRVEARVQPLRKSSGAFVTSTTCQEFKLHTDEYSSLDPASIVIFQCVWPDNHGGGKTLLADIEDVVEVLDNQTLQLLRSPLFPHPCELVSLISGQVGQLTVRFNIDDIVSYYHSANAEMPPEIRGALQSILVAASQVAVTIKLVQGDCLILDNARILHGRSAFDPSGGRLLKRVRVHSKSSALRLSRGLHGNSRLSLLLPHLTAA